MSVRVLQGDVRAMLATLPADSVHAVITSVPYWGLRSYSTEPQTWGGAVLCEHEWGQEGRRKSSADSATGISGPPRHGNEFDTSTGAFCIRCNAWRGEHGQEPTVALYLAHEVEIWRALRRVLRPDGVAWLNIGDTYAGGVNGRSAAATKAAGTDDRTYRDKPFSTVGGALKAKDLCLVPERLAIALQDSEWWIRARLPWVKRSAMPDSTTDRPGVAVEYWFMLTKRARYFWDAAAVRQADKGTDHPRNVLHKPEPSGGIMSPHAGIRTTEGRNGQGRNFRDADLLFASLEPPHGLISDGEGNPLALDVNTAGFAEAHFATFPPKLIEPLIKASTSERGCCPACGAPWVRVVETERRAGSSPTRNDGEIPIATGNRDRKDAEKRRHHVVLSTIGWRPSCACPAAEPVPATILDPFGGAGTTGLVADRLGRDAILIELQPEYAEMARRRIADDSPLFAEVTP